MSAVLDHLRRNLVGYIALFVALGGTGYAALQLPAGSVGAQQIQNHVIDPVKLDPRLINGSVRAWASVSANGRVTAGGGRPKVSMGRNGFPGLYVVTWRVASLIRCAPIADVDDASVAPGFALASLAGPRARRGAIAVNTYDFHGQRAALPFNVAVIC
jgi:hypothetical protein